MSTLDKTKINDEIYHFTSNFYDMFSSSGVEFNEKDIFQVSKEWNLQQEDPWVICLICKDHECKEI